MGRSTLVAQHCQTIYQLPQTAHGIDLHACYLPCNSDTSMFRIHHVTCSVKNQGIPSFVLTNAQIRFLA